MSMDAKGERVLFPRAMVEQAIASAPASFWLHDRDGNPHSDIGGDRVHFVPGSSGLRVLDHRTGETRHANTADFTEYVRLGDGLANIPYLATAFSTNDDIEAQVSDAWRLYLCLTNSRKPIVSGAFTEHGVPRMVEMMQLFRSDRADLIARPMSIFTITATGNFRYSEDSCQNLIDCVEAGVAVEIVPVTLMGLIAPVTIVGATVFHTADVLAGITMAQVIRPGAPVGRCGDRVQQWRLRWDSREAAGEAVSLEKLKGGLHNPLCGVRIGKAHAIVVPQVSPFLA
jgi:trimethylamine--corrinoid protein Co-methyltransferase